MRVSSWVWDGALATAAVVALVILPGRSQSPGVEIQLRDPPDGVDELRVDVAGAVAHPGVVSVAPGDRVADALALAGGPTSEADTSALNLSRRLVDQDHVVVPRISDRPSAALDLNVATAPQLEALPAIGKVTAAAILASRERDGRFTSTDDLLTRGLLSARAYEAIRDLIRVP